MSGAALAGVQSWIATGTLQADRLTLVSCEQVANLRNSGVELDIAYGALRNHLARQKRATVGIDTPLGLPRSSSAGSDWAKFARDLNDDCADVEAFRRTYKPAPYEWRTTDRDQQRRLHPAGRKHAFRTFHTLRDLVGPLVKAKKLVVAPMQRPQPDRLLAIEAAPDAYVRRHRLGRPFTGQAPLAVSSRERVLAHLETQGVVLEPAARGPALDDPLCYALDAVLAAAIASQVVQTPEVLEVPEDSPYRREGRAYA